MLKFILGFVIIYISIIFVGLALTLIEHKYKAYKNKKWSIKFMDKVQKFQFK